MSLTGWLVIVGVLVVAGVVIHGAWAARRAGPRGAGESVPPPVAERREPSLAEHEAVTAATPGADAPASAAPVASEAAAGDAAVPSEPAFESRPLPRRHPARIDALIDAIVPLTLEAPIAAEFALMHMPATRRAGSKPFLIEGLDTETGEWEPITPGHHYSEVQAGVLLANRGGPLNEIEYSEFIQKIEAFAQGIGAMPDAPDMLDVAARARELDQFASAHDAQLALRLVPANAAWAVGFVVQNAARHGFVPGALPGRLVVPGEEDGAPPMLTLSFDPQAALADQPSQAVVSELTLSLDVPQTSAAAEPYAAWQEAARSLAQDLDANLIDDAGQPLNLHAFATIGADLGRLYAQLELRDLPAGSQAARRLFS
jgi:hypothetical protein